MLAAQDVGGPWLLQAKRESLSGRAWGRLEAYGCKAPDGGVLAKCAAWCVMSCSHAGLQAT